MKTALYVLAGILIRDAWCWAADKVWCWRRRRQAQREARENRELRVLAAQYSARQFESERAELKSLIESERLKKALNPQLLGGRRVIFAPDDKSFLRITEHLYSNFRALGKLVVDANFEEN
jgi:hypothetical protein